MRELAGETQWLPPPLATTFFRDHMSRPGALIYALEHCQLTDRFPRWFGSIIANCPHIDARSYMIGNMFVEEVKDPTIDQGHNESMWSFAQALGASEAQIRNHEPMIVTTMAMRYFDDISRTLPWLEAFAAIAVLELITNAPIAATYGHVPTNSRAPWAKLGLTAKALEHWQAAEAADHGSGETGPGHGEEALEILVRYALTDEQQQRCAAALREAILVKKYQYDRIAERAIRAAQETGAGV
jgi:pyrroloquinoline quinone (PQQ) biosynthesis protein C